MFHVFNESLGITMGMLFFWPCLCVSSHDLQLFYLSLALISNGRGLCPAVTELEAMNMTTGHYIKRIFKYSKIHKENLNPSQKRHNIVSVLTILYV